MRKHTTKRRKFIRIILIDVFSFTDQDKITYGLGYNFVWEVDNKDNASFRKIGVAKVVLTDISWFV